MSIEGPVVSGRRGIHLFRGWWIVGTGYVAQMAAAGASGWVFGVLLSPMEAGLGWSRTELVGALTVSSIVGGLLAARLGPVIDRHGVRTLMTLSALIGGSALVCVSFVQEPWQYYLCWALFGTATPGFGLLGPRAAIANWFIRKRSLAFMFFTFGSATAGIVLAPAMAQVATGPGWRLAWVLMGVLVWVVAPLAWLTVRRRPEDVGLLPDGAALDGAVNRSGSSSAGPGALDQDVVWTVRAALRTRAFWLATVGLTLVSLPASSIFIHMVPYVVTKGFSLGAGATVVSVYGFSALVGRAVWGLTIGRIGVHRSLILYAFSYGASVALFVLPNSLALIYATTVLLGVSIAGGQQLQAQVYPDYFGRYIVGALSGYSGLSYTLARAVAPLYAAILFDATGSYEVAFGTFAACCLVAGLAFVAASPPTPPTALRREIRSGLGSAPSSGDSVH